MQYKNNKPVLPQEIYVAHLKNINDVALSQREIDVIACVLSGRSAKGIAHFLSISYKTVQVHAYNAMKKLGCTSRESMIALIEKSSQFLPLKEYYLSLLTHSTFQNCLKEFTKLGNGHSPKCLMVYWQKNESSFLHHLKTHLTLAGITVALEFREKNQSFSQLIQEAPHDIYTLYALPNTWLEEFQAELHEGSEQSSWESSKHQSNILFLLFEAEQSREIPQKIKEFAYIDCAEQKNYYYSVFEILKKLFPNLELEKIITEFEEKNDGLSNFSNLSPPSSISSEEGILKEPNNPVDLQSGKFLGNRKWQVLSATFLILSLSCLGLLVLKKNQTDVKTKLSVRSDLVIPSESTLLNRPNLISRIDSYFQKQSHDIQTVALIGIGGSGKTTVVRQYARSQKLPVVWEINAETQASLRNSFENLAYALSKTDEDKKVLRTLQDNKNETEREKKIIQLVKGLLRSQSDWLLIYDNVEQFSDIQKYFPSDPNVWGKGKVILTTRDSHIHMHVGLSIQIEGLEPSEKLDLFFKIMGHRSAPSLFSIENGQVKEVLNNIPPFPLDISTAAYYLKATSISCEEYLTRLRKGNSSFVEMQGEILKESTEYVKTRYGIIVLSLKDFIEKNKNLFGLLLFVSLLDSQDIPRDLLNKYKEDSVVDKFIYLLKKYSLINNGSPLTPTVSQTFCIHRSTQTITLSYLKKMMTLEENKDFISLISSALEQYIIDVMQKEDFVRMKAVVNHCEKFINHSGLIGINSLSLSSRMGRIYYLLGDYPKSQKILEKNLEILNGLKKIDYRLKADILSYLGNTYKKLGYYEKAGELLEQNLSIHKQYFPEPENEIEIARVLTSLGSLYRDRGKYDKAKDLLEQSLAIYKTYFPDNPNEFSRTLTYLGNIYRCTGQPKKSKDLLEQSLAIYKTYFPENHINIAWVLVHLSAAYRSLKEYDKAISLLEQALLIYKSYFPEDHVEVAWVLTHFGNTYRKLGDYEKAKASYEKSLIIYKKSYGKSHLTMGRVLRNLGGTYILEGNMEDAENTLHQALEIFLKKHHPDTYKCFKLLIELNLKKSLKEKDKGNFQKSLYFKDQAVNYLKKAIGITKTHFPGDSKSLVKLQNNFQNLLA